VSSFSITELLFKVFSLKNAINALNFVTSSTLRGFKFWLNPYIHVDPRNLNAAPKRLRAHHVTYTSRNSSLCLISFNFWFFLSDSDDILYQTVWQINADKTNQTFRTVTIVEDLYIYIYILLYLIQLCTRLKNVHTKIAVNPKRHYSKTLCYLSIFNFMKCGWLTLFSLCIIA
jgi:hypothetical protein